MSDQDDYIRSRLKDVCVGMTFSALNHHFKIFRSHKVAVNLHDSTKLEEDHWPLYKNRIYDSYLQLNKKGNFDQDLKNKIAFPNSRPPSGTQKAIKREKNTVGVHGRGSGGAKLRKRINAASDFIGKPLSKLSKVYNLRVAEISARFNKRYKPSTLVSKSLYIDVIALVKKIEQEEKYREVNLDNQNSPVSLYHQLREHLTYQFPDEPESQSDRPASRGEDLKEYRSNNINKLSKKENVKPRVLSESVEPPVNREVTRNLVAFEFEGNVELSKWDWITFKENAVLFRHKGEKYILGCKGAQKVLNYFKEEFATEGLQYTVVYKDKIPQSVHLPGSIRGRIDRLVARMSTIEDFGRPINNFGTLSSNDFIRYLRDGRIKTNDYIEYLYRYQAPGQTIHYFEEEDDDKYVLTIADYSLLFTLTSQHGMSVVVWECTRDNTATYCFHKVTPQRLPSLIKKIGAYITDPTIDNKRERMKRRYSGVVEEFGEYEILYHDYDSRPDERWRGKVQRLLRK